MNNKTCRDLLKFKFRNRNTNFNMHLLKLRKTLIKLTTKHHQEVFKIFRILQLHIQY